MQDVVSKALRRAWQLGQTYWQQADSDSYRQNKQSGETQAVFVKLVDETRAALATPAQAVPASVIMASVMRDDGGEHPAFCLMVAYRAEKDAKAALAMLTDEPAQQAAPAPASHPVAAPAGMQPVARIRYERNTPGRENEMPRVVSCNRMADGVYEVFTAAQVQAMLAAVPRNATLYNPDDVAFPVQRSADGTDALPPELASIAAAKKGGQHGF